MMFAKYFEYYTIILDGGVFLWTRCCYGLAYAVRCVCRHVGNVA